MWSLTKVVGLVILPLMIGSAILGSLQTMQTEAVDEEYGAMDAILDREQNSLIINQNTIENADNSEFQSNAPGREIFRDVIAVNQLSALNCNKAGNLISGHMVMANVAPEITDARNGEEEEVKTGFRITLPEELKEDLPDDRPYYALPGRAPEGSIPDHRLERVPNYALQFTDYSPRCVGVQKASSFMPDTGMLTDPVGYAVGGTADTIGSIGENTFEYFMCKSTPDWIKTSGNDMEGRYGRVPFQISDDLEEPIILSSKIDKADDLRRDGVWTANFGVESDGFCWQGVAAGSVLTGTAAVVGGAGGTAAGGPAAGATVAIVASSSVATSTTWSDTETELIPTMLGGTFSRYAPYHEDVINGDLTWPEDLDLRDGHVVVDAPVLLHDDETYVDGPSDPEVRGDRFRESASYVLCPGVEGYIQTNREDGGKSGGEHTVSDNPGYSDSRITTYVRVTSDQETAESCMDDSDGYVEIRDRLSIKYFDSCDSSYEKCGDA